MAHTIARPLHLFLDLLLSWDLSFNHPWAPHSRHHSLELSFCFFTPLKIKISGLRFSNLHVLSSSPLPLLPSPWQVLDATRAKVLSHHFIGKIDTIRRSCTLSTPHLSTYLHFYPCQLASCLLLIKDNFSTNAMDSIPSGFLKDFTSASVLSSSCMLILPSLLDQSITITCYLKKAKTLSWL